MPEAVLLDWNMPVMDGYRVLGHLRRLPGGDGRRWCSAPPRTASTHISRALHAGANEYIMKPFDKDIVAAKFQEVGLIAVAKRDSGLRSYLTAVLCFCEAS